MNINPLSAYEIILDGSDVIVIDIEGYSYSIRDSKKMLIRNKPEACIELEELCDNNNDNKEEKINHLKLKIEDYDSKIEDIKKQLEEIQDEQDEGLKKYSRACYLIQMSRDLSLKLKNLEYQRAQAVLIIEDCKKIAT